MVASEEVTDIDTNQSFEVCEKGIVTMSRSHEDDDNMLNALNENGNAAPMDDVVQGMMYASLAITDDKEDTLKNVGKMNPWHIEALSVITGSEDEAYKPLSYILREHMDGLEIDCHMDVNGITKGGHFLDTQGYIAHNDTTIVLSYRCTTSIFDWMTNFSASSSEWEIEEDAKQGFSGQFSSCEGLWCCFGTQKPRVHTGFYNNFLATLPMIQEHINPLLAPDQPPRKLFICGHSLGAGLATLAAAYFVLEYDWQGLPHTMCMVTAGSPRACGAAMRKDIDACMQEHGSSAALYRLVRGRDVVTTVPPSGLGFKHICEPICISKENVVTWPGAERATEENTGEDEIKNLVRGVPTEDDGEDNADDDDAAGDDKDEYFHSERYKKYKKMVAKIPEPFRDHMPDFYLKPLFDAKGIKCGSKKL